MSRYAIAFLGSVLALLFLQNPEIDAETEQRTNLAAVFDLLVNVGKQYYEINGVGQDRRRYDCPLCDSSVYSYCSDKLLHDACCCLDPYEHRLPYQCRYADCSFLHANSCKEHKLITACCCGKLLHGKV